MLNWSIFFEKEDLERTYELITTLERLRVGKVKLSGIRSNNDMRYIMPHILEKQIYENRECVKDFEKLLGKLGYSFKKQLSTINVSKEAVQVNA